MNFNLDIAIFTGFLILNLILGFYYGRGTNSMREFAIGNRNFSTAAIVATLVATWVSGGSFSLYMSETYSQGLHFILAIFADAGSFLIIGYLFAPRMVEFLGQLSVAEAMGSLYGKHIRIITALAGFIGTIGALALQFKVSSTILSYLFGISPIYSLIASSAVVILYSAFGGVKSVTFTDIIQFFMFGTIIPVIIFVVWNTFDNQAALMHTLTQNPIFDYNEVFNHNNPKFWTTITIFIYFLIPGLSPATFQRITMAKNVNQVQRSFIIAAFVLLAVELLIAWIAILILSKEPNLDPNNLINYIMDSFAAPGFKGLIITGIMAMIMSTTDSYINSASVIFAHDFCRPIGIASEKNVLSLSRFFSIVLGITALLLTFSGASFLNLFLLGYSFYMIVVTVPFIMAIFGFRSTTKSVLIGMITGVSTVIIWSYLGNPEIDSVIPGMIANLISLLGSHYLLKQPGGWVGIKDDSVLKSIRANRKKKIQLYLANIKNFNLLKFAKSNNPKHESNYVILGFFCIVSILSIIYTLPKELRDEHIRLINFMYYSSLILSTSIITYTIWPISLKKEIIITSMWNLGMFYMLVFIPSLMILISNFAQIQLIVFLINLIIISLIFRWQIALTMSFIGVFLSFQFYPHCVDNGSGIAGVDISSQFKIIYSLLLFSSILIAFIKPKQEQQALSEEKVEHLSDRVEDRERALDAAEGLKEEFIRNLTHEFHAPMTGIRSTVETLYEVYDDLPEQARKKAVQNIYQSSVRLEAFEASLVSLSKLANANYQFDIKQIDLSELVLESLKICRKLYIEDKDQDKREFILNIEDKVVAKVDEYYIKQTIDHLIINAITYCKEGKITITLSQKRGHVEFSISDQGVGIPHNELGAIFGAFSISSRTRTPAGGRGVGLALCKKVIELHDGKIWAEHNDSKNNKEKGATFKFILPV